MALASGHALVPPDGKRSVGNSHRSPGQSHGPRSDLLYKERLVALHGFIKKTRATPENELALARKRQKELENEQEKSGIKH